MRRDDDHRLLVLTARIRPRRRRCMNVLWAVKPPDSAPRLIRQGFRRETGSGEPAPGSREIRPGSTPLRRTCPKVVWRLLRRPCPKVVRSRPSPPGPARRSRGSGTPADTRLWGRVSCATRLWGGISRTPRGRRGHSGTRSTTRCRSRSRLAASVGAPTFDLTPALQMCWGHFRVLLNARWRFLKGTSGSA